MAHPPPTREAIAPRLRALSHAKGGPITEKEWHRHPERLCTATSTALATVLVAIPQRYEQQEYASRNWQAQARTPVGRRLVARGAHAGSRKSRLTFL